MVALRTILVAVDFSATSARALEYARFLADASAASLHLIHVMACPLGGSDGCADQRRDVCERLEALLTETDRTNRGSTTVCTSGSAASEIDRYVRDHGVDLVVMGTHYHGPAFQMGRGSVAELVLGTVPCAVLAVKDLDAPA